MALRARDFMCDGGACGSHPRRSLRRVDPYRRPSFALTIVKSDRCAVGLRVLVEGIRSPNFLQRGASMNVRVVPEYEHKTTPPKKNAGLQQHLSKSVS